MTRQVPGWLVRRRAVDDIFQSMYPTPPECPDEVIKVDPQDKQKALLEI